MKTNLGNLDRAARLLIAVVGITLYFMNMISGTVAIVLLVVAGILTLTSLFSFCPIYAAFGLSTKKAEK